MAAMDTRLKCDPLIAVGDLQRCFREQVRRADLWHTVQCPRGAQWSWKTAINVEWLYQSRYLLQDLLGVAPNAVLPSVKLRAAVRRCLETPELRMSKHGMDVETYTDGIDQRVRVLMSQLRDLKKDDKYFPAMRKASLEEREGLDKLLTFLQDPASAKTAQKAEASQPSTSSASASTALVLWQPPKDQAAGSSVFSRILAKKGSEESEFRADPPKASPSKRLRASQPFRVRALCSPRKNQASPRKQASPREAALSDVLDSEAAKAVDEALVSSPTKKRALKKPAAAFKKPAAATKKKTKKAPKTEEAATEEGEKKKFKTTFKHRKTSQAYHREKCLQERLGLSPQSAKKKAREKMREVAALIDSGKLVETD
ncbi:unnamed protein product [Symbiodinium sp. CCMP2592]|nr:unnamed protein product [Symbiodinium sp. CCMP2592]